MTPAPTIDQSVVAALLAAAAVLLMIGGALLFQAERARDRRLSAFIGDHMGKLQHLDEPIAPRGYEPRLVERFNRRLLRTGLSARMRRELIRAGAPLRPGQFLYLRVVATVLAGLLGILIAKPVMPLLQPMVVLIAAFAGWMLPMTIIKMLQRRRVAAFERHMPDAIDIMAGSLEAGSSLPMALELVAREIPPPVSTEFARALREVSLGMSLDDALRNMLDRVYSEDLDMLATAVAIQYRVGGNLAEVLKIIAHTIRERVRIRGDIKTLTAQQTISANILTGLPIALAALLFVLNPSYEARLLEPGFPQLATISAVIMVALAYVIMRRIVRIDG